MFPPHQRVKVSILGSLRDREVERSAVYVNLGRGPSVVVSPAAFHARVRGSVPGLGGLK